MVAVYAVSLALGLVGLLWFIFGGTLAENLGRAELDPGVRFGHQLKMVVGAIAGFGMGGMSAEFSPLDFTWQASLLIALLASVLSIAWVRYSVSRAES